MTHRIFDKTEKGREEIATRKYQLTSRLRPLLVMVDGKQDSDTLLKKLAGIGLTEASITELLNNGFIRLTFQQEPVPVETPSPQDKSTRKEVPVPTPVTDVTSQFQAIYQFYTETIKSTIGLRGYGLQLKVEKAASINDFRALRDPYLEAVLKSKGKEIARSIRARLDQLLYLDETAPNTTGIGSSAAFTE